MIYSEIKGQNGKSATTSKAEPSIQKDNVEKNKLAAKTSADEDSFNHEWTYTKTDINKNYTNQRYLIILHHLFKLESPLIPSWMG